MTRTAVGRQVKKFVERLLWCVTVAAIAIHATSGEGLATKARQLTFATPEAAFDTMMKAIRTGESGQLTALFGPAVHDIFPADPAENAALRKRFAAAYDEKFRLERRGENKAVLHVGDNDWPWPVPVVKTGKRWRFDTVEGIREIVARRIGKNEISAVQVCLAYVDAQREYAAEHRIGDIGEYSQKLVSDPGLHNGLCWEAKDGEKPSFLGPLIVGACKTELTGMTPLVTSFTPYHGYYYKILKGQGSAAPGGAYNYVLDGKMIGGFALVAYPAVYGASGIMTFIVDKDGIVYEKDLGRNTEKIAETMESYNPDATWKKVD